MTALAFAHNVTICFQQAENWRLLMEWLPVIIAALTFIATSLLLALIVRRE